MTAVDDRYGTQQTTELAKTAADFLARCMQKRKNKTFADGILVVKDGQECVVYTEVKLPCTPAQFGNSDFFVQLRITFAGRVCWVCK